MNKEQVEGNWEQFKGAIKAQWGKLTDDEILMAKGERDKFFGKVKEKHGVAKEEAEEFLNKSAKSFGYSEYSNKHDAA